VIHAVTLAPLPEIKIRPLKTPNGNNSGVLNIINFAGATDYKKKMREIRGENELGGSIDGSMNSSAIGTELNRKITVIKKEGGARIFHVNRHSGVPLIHPTIRKHDYIETADIPPPMALFPLRKEVKSEANLPVKEKDDDESYRLSDDEVKLEEI